MIVLREFVRDLEPRRFMLDEDMLVGFQFRVVVEKTGRNLAPLGTGIRIRHWRAASTAK